MTLKLGNKDWFVFIIAILILTDIFILLDYPILRQIFGFFFITFLPGVLILQVLKLNKIEVIARIALSIGLSITFLLFFGLLINNLSTYFSYKTPLSTTSLLIFLNIAFILLAIVGYIINKNKVQVFSLSNINLNRYEKCFLIIPILFPALSIFGMHLMNTRDNNIILMFLLFLIPTYVVFVCFFDYKFTKRFYPVVIFLISISLLLLLALRSNHIVGMDIHTEYLFFKGTLDNRHWSIEGRSPLDACLSISLLPAIYQSILNISSEFLFKVLYSIIYSISPLVIYIISKKYIDESYAFLTSCFFMFQSIFLFTAYNPRTSIAILFVGLLLMTLFDDEIDPLKKKFLIIVFFMSCSVSHYSTTYILFFSILGAFIGMEILSKRYSIKKRVISLTTPLIFFVFIFFWYSQVSGAAFDAGVKYVENTFMSLSQFFVDEMRSESVQSVMGEGITEKGIPHKIQFMLTWLTFGLIGIGIVATIWRYKEMLFSELNFKKADFLKVKFEVEYFVIALCFSGLLVVMLGLPYISLQYNVDRLWAVAIISISIFFVIGGITLSQVFFIFKKKMKREKIRLFGKAFTFTKYSKAERSQKNIAYIIILLLLIPYFLCVTGIMYNIFSVPRAIILNSEGEQYNMMYVHDQDSYGIKWLVNYRDKQEEIAADFYLGSLMFRSQAEFHGAIQNLFKFKPKGYIYLRYVNVVEDKLQAGGTWHDKAKYKREFEKRNKLYDTGGSEVWKM